MDAFTKSFSDTIQHWPAFFGMAAIDYLRVMASQSVNLPGGGMFNTLALSGIRGAGDLVKVDYAQKVFAIEVGKA